MANLDENNLLLKINEARKEGYSESEIINFLSEKDARFKDASEQGYNLNQISDFLNQRQKQTEANTGQYSYDPMLTGQPSQEDTNRGNQAQSDFRNVATTALKNVPSSAGTALKDLVTAIASPLQTGKSILDLGAGA